MNNKKARGLNGVVFLVFVVFLFAALWFTNQFDQREKEISWKKFQQLVQNDKIESVEVNQNKSVPTGRVEITLKGDDSSDNVRYLYVSDVNEIQDYLKEQNVDYTMPDIPQDSWAATTFLPVILTLVGVFLIFGLMNRQGGGANSKAMNFGKSRAKLSTDRDKKVTFAQVAGLEEEKEELEEIVDFLKSPKKYIQVGARIPKGVLLVGLREPVRRCLPKQLPEKQEFRSLRSPVQTLWKCSLVSELPVSETCSRKRRRMHRVLFSSMRSMQLQDAVEPEWAADTMSVSRH